MNKENYLLPCPFCGGEPVIEQKGQNGLRIFCKECHIEKTQKVLRYSLEWLRMKMIENWNKRINNAKETNT